MSTREIVSPSLLARTENLDISKLQGMWLPSTCSMWKERWLLVGLL